MTNNNTLHYRKVKPAHPDDLYANRNAEALGEHFMRHIDRMTVEGLHSKSAIAGELAHRDAEIAALRLDKKELLDALETIMTWQVKHVDKWDNPAYDNAAKVVAAMAQGVQP